MPSSAALKGLHADMPSLRPSLSRQVHGGLAFLTDDALCRGGVVVAFSERRGGISAGPYASLDLAEHVGDDPAAVDENRRRFLDALGIVDRLERLTLAEQVHGDVVAEVGEAEAGAGRSACEGPPPVPGTDALLTILPGVPLMLLYADCVPVVLVAPGPTQAVAVVHAGWRGALASLPGKAAAALAARAGVAPSSLIAYVGPHVCPEHYEVSEELVSQFADKFATIGAVSRRLDLGAAVLESLTGAGVVMTNVCRAGTCTADATDRFYSYRAEGLTGRHAALVAILT